MSSVYVTAILFIYLTQTGHGFMQGYSSKFESSGDIRYQVPSSSYLVRPALNYKAIISNGYEGFISNYEINFLNPVEGQTLKFQVWEPTNTVNEFILRGENVFENVKGQGYTYLYPNDVDQILIRSNYTIGLYVNDYSSIPYNLQYCNQPMRITDESNLNMGQTYTFSEYDDDGTNQCMAFAFSVGIVEMDLSCKILEMPSINYEGTFTTDTFTDSGPQHQCWVIRMMRPCGSSYKTGTSPSVKAIRSDMYYCDQQKVEVRDGGTSMDGSSGFVCGNFGTVGQSFNGNNFAMYVDYTSSSGDIFNYDKPFEMKYFFNAEYNYLSDDFQYCEGEYNPRKASSGLIIGISVGVVVFVIIVIIAVIVCCCCCCKSGNKPKPSSNSTAPATNTAGATTGSTQPMVAMGGPATITQKPYTGAPTVAYPAQVQQVPGQGQYPQQQQPYPPQQGYPMQPYPQQPQPTQGYPQNLPPVQDYHQQPQPTPGYQQLPPIQGYPQQTNPSQVYPPQPQPYPPPAYPPQPPTNGVPPPSYESATEPSAPGKE